jgi:hypothetical protein
MRRVRFEYFCDLCKKKINVKKMKGSAHITNDVLTTKMDEGGKSGTSWYMEWDLCPECFKEKFDCDSQKALNYFKEVFKEDDDD